MGIGDCRRSDFAPKHLIHLFKPLLRSHSGDQGKTSFSPSRQSWPQSCWRPTVWPGAALLHVSVQYDEIFIHIAAKVSRIVGIHSRDAGVITNYTLSPKGQNRDSFVGWYKKCLELFRIQKSPFCLENLSVNLDFRFTFFLLGFQATYSQGVGILT